MKRKDLVQSLLSGESQLPSDSGALQRPRVPSGAVRAMGLELARIGDEAAETSKLREQLLSGATVVDLDPSQVEASFMSDRLPQVDDKDFRQLVQSMRESGQQVPILVRPHPKKADVYQIAFGHRRRDAAHELGIPVKAVVRQLSDQELVVAQGKENAERRDLTFIERASFAAALDQRGFSRGIINSALGVQTSETTRLLSVASSVPQGIIRAIGPAPKVGRPRWLELAKLLERNGGHGRAAAFIKQPAFSRLSSDRRFEALMAVLREGERRDGIYEFYDARGAVVARAERFAKVLRISVDERAAPDLGPRLLELLPELARNAGNGGGSS